MGQARSCRTAKTACEVLTGAFEQTEQMETEVDLNRLRRSPLAAFRLEAVSSHVQIERLQPA